MSFATLHHLDCNQVARALGLFSAALRAGGILLATFRAGAHYDKFTLSDPTRPGPREFWHYSPSLLAELASGAALSVVRLDELEAAAVPWLRVVLQKPAVV